MLKTRIYTVFVLLPLVLLAIWFLPNRLFSGLSGALIGWAAWEWSGLISVNIARHKLLRMIYTLLVIFLLPLAHSLDPIWGIATILGWLWALVGVIVYAKGWVPLGFHWPWLKACFGLLVLPAAWVAIIRLRAEHGGSPALLLFALVLIWAVDIGAYFVGRFAGKHILAARVSPNKTWEGLWAGLGLSVLIALIAGLFDWPFALKLSIPLALLTALFAVFGDLFESVLKREVNVKDTSNLLPGHGGILDRIDSLLAGLPVFAVGFSLIQLLF